jgi:hypothetical protein
LQSFNSCLTNQGILTEREQLSTLDLLVLTSLAQLLLIGQTLLSFLLNKLP